MAGHKHSSNFNNQEVEVCKLEHSLGYTIFCLTCLKRDRDR